jgi:hypothetical protein
MRRAAAPLCALVALAASGCETTQQLSAKIGRRLGQQNAIAGTSATGARNRDVRVDATALIAGHPAAVAVELTNESATAQANVPVTLDVRDAKGGSVYRNDTKGIEPSLQQIARLPGHATLWWVDDQILSSGVPSAVTVRVGTPTAPAQPAPPITVSGASASDAFPGPHVSATLRNASSVAARQVAVYAVTIRGGRAVGAGRALVASLAAGARASVTIPITGVATGTRIELTVAS